MNSNYTIGVTTVCFSKNKTLREKLNQCGFRDVRFNPEGKRLTPEELQQFLAPCDLAIVGLDRIDESVLAVSPDLKAVSKYGVGLDNIDQDACRRAGVEVLYTAGVNRRSVSEEVLGCMLMLIRNLYVTSNQLKQGVWNKNGGRQLSGKTVGVIGVGHIGTDVITLLRPFGCRILVNDIENKSDLYAELGVESVSKEQLFRESDLVTIHTPLTDLTREMVNYDSLSLMKPSAFLINTARGGIVNLSDLKEALIRGTIAGAALDVYDSEPPQDQELIALPNLVNTPHIGGNSEEAVLAMGLAAIENCTAWIARQEE